MSLIDDLSEHFREFPGIGPRQAKRFVYFLLSKDRGYTDNLAKRIQKLKDESSQCAWCRRYFMEEADEEGRCRICANPNRDRSELMILAKDTELETVEKANAYDGLYFVLGNTIPILEKDPEKRIREKELLHFVKRLADSGELKEIILALSLNPEGENTADYVSDKLSGIANDSNIKLTRLGRGFSTGTEVEYSDDATLRNALKNRN